MKLELQAPSLPCRRKIPSMYFEGNVQPDHYSKVEDFYRQIYFEPTDTVANSIVECFNQKDYTLYANCEQVLLKGTLEKLVSQNVDQLCEFYIEFDSDILRIQLSILAESYYSFRQGEGMCYTLHNVIDFLKKQQKDLVPHTRGHVLSQDYSGYTSNKC